MSETLSKRLARATEENHELNKRLAEADQENRRLRANMQNMVDQSHRERKRWDNQIDYLNRSLTAHKIAWHRLNKKAIEFASAHGLRFLEGSQDAVLNLFDEVAVRIVAASSKDTRKDTDEKKSPSRFSLLEVDDD